MKMQKIPPIKFPSKTVIAKINCKEAKHKGLIAAIEPKSGDYFLGKKTLEAVDKGRAKYPDAIFFCIRIGNPAVHEHRGGLIKLKIIAGVIADLKSIVKARIKRGALEFSARGDLEFVVDTGFTGDILFPVELVKKLDLTFVSYDSFQLATKQTIALPVYRGKVALDRAIHEVEMTPGDALVGMSLMQAIGSQLILDFDRARHELRA